MSHFGDFLKAFRIATLLPPLTMGWIMSCQDEDLTAQYIRVKMLGVLEDTQDLDRSSGEWLEPISQTYSLENIVMFSQGEQGEQLHELYDLSEAGEFRITDRMQRIFRSEIDNNSIDLEISKFVLVFSNNVSGVSKFKNDHTLDLVELASCQPSQQVSSALTGLGDSCVLEFNEGFTIKVGQSYNVIVQVQWKNTVLRVSSADNKVEETMIPPPFASA